MKQWQYHPEDGDNAISEVETDDVVLYVDDVKPEVITQIVTMHNEEYSLTKIRKYLEQEKQVTPDEVEFIMGELERYEELENTAGTEKEAPFPLNLEAEVEGDIPQPTKPLTAEELAQTLTAIADNTVKQEKMALYGDVTETEKIVDAIGTGKRGKRTASTTGKKKQSLEDMIQEMESKIELAKVFKNLPEMPFPENLSKPGRDLMLRFQKEYKELVEKYIGEIQEL